VVTQGGGCEGSDERSWGPAQPTAEGCKQKHSPSRQRFGTTIRDIGEVGGGAHSTNHHHLCPNRAMCQRGVVGS
jgi:hypothetical protein